jgi:hypothetical protein
MLSVTGVVVAGCQASGGDNPSSNASNATSGTPTATAAMCDKCRAMWVQYPTAPNAAGGRTYLLNGYTEQGQTVCASCRTTAETMFASGKGQQACPDCGGTVKMAAMH